MNILERAKFYKEQYEELKTFFDDVDTYLTGYDTEGLSVDAMMKEFFHVFGKYNISKRDFIHVAESLGYEHKQMYSNGRRYYTLVKG